MVIVSFSTFTAHFCSPLNFHSWIHRCPHQFSHPFQEFRSMLKLSSYLSYNTLDLQIDAPSWSRFVSRLNCWVFRFLSYQPDLGLKYAIPTHWGTCGLQVKSKHLYSSQWFLPCKTGAHPNLSSDEIGSDTLLGSSQFPFMDLHSFWIPHFCRSKSPSLLPEDSL